MSGRIQFQFALGPQPASKSRENSSKRILILADLGAGKNTDKLAARKIFPIDVDNFDEVLQTISPQLHIPLNDLQAGDVRIDIRQLDDFHPDGLFLQLPIFESLRGMRRRLENPASFAAATEAIKRGLTDAPTLPIQSEPDITAAPPAATDSPKGSLFEQLLGNTVIKGPSAKAPHEDAVHRLIRQIVEPHLTKGVAPDEQRQWLSVVDDAIGQLVRTILHHSVFQRIESTWRAIHWLISRIETGESRRVFVLDASEADLAADLTQADGHGEQTAIYRLLLDNSVGVPGGDPWSLIIGDYTFGSNVESLDFLELLGAVSSGCGGAFVGAASPALLGCMSLTGHPDLEDWPEPSAELAERWRCLRLSPAARFTGLALPRFMLRQPYGKRSDPVDGFQFEEMVMHPPHEAYLWGNPAFACGALIAEAWAQGDDATVGTLREIRDLPTHTIDEGGELVMKPCAEVYLNEKTANAILGQGIMPLLSVKNSNRVLVPRLQSVAQTPTDLL